jgi:hypothetical protein
MHLILKFLRPRDREFLPQPKRGQKIIRRHYTTSIPLYQKVICPLHSPLVYNITTLQHWSQQIKKR